MTPTQEPATDGGLTDVERRQRRGRAPVPAPVVPMLDDVSTREAP